MVANGNFVVWPPNLNCDAWRRYENTIYCITTSLTNLFSQQQFKLLSFNVSLHDVTDLKPNSWSRSCFSFIEIRNFYGIRT